MEYLICKDTNLKSGTFLNVLMISDWVLAQSYLTYQHRPIVRATSNNISLYTQYKLVAKYFTNDKP